MLIMQIANKEKIIYPELSYKLSGIIYSVQNNLGRFCNEKQYGDALEYRLKEILEPSFIFVKRAVVFIRICGLKIN